MEDVKTLFERRNNTTVYIPVCPPKEFPNLEIH